MKEIKDIIIFGHTGYLGRFLFYVLNKKFKKKNMVKGYSSKEINLLQKTCKKKIEKVIKENSVVIICSAIKSNFGNSYELMNDNIQMIGNLINVLKHKKVNKVIYLSSGAVYGVFKKNKVINEFTKIEPDTYYGLSKYVSEILLKINLRDKRKLIILRPSIVYGPGEDIITASPSGFFKLIKKKKNSFNLG